MTVNGILENIISDIIFLLIAIIFAWLWILFTQRKKLISFFDVEETRRLVVYLSNIRVAEFGAVGITGKRMSYKGETITNGEIQAAYQIQKLFTFIIPALAEASKTIGTFLLSDVTVQIQISPVATTQLDSQASVISLGSPAYNAASLFIENTNKGIVKFRYGSMTISELQGFAQFPPESAFSSTDSEYTYPGGSVSYPVPSGTFAQPTSYANPGNNEQPEPPAIIVDQIPPILDTTYGFIERIKDNNKRSLFYVAGMSEYATKGAAYQLSSQWSQLYKKYGKDKPFLIMLKIDTSDFAKCSIVFEKDLS
jgi:hypothetical protein